LKREVATLRAEVELRLKLTSEVAALKTEVAAARRVQPNFEGKLNVLQEQVDKHQRSITRLRGEQSQLAYAQQQLDAEQQKNRQQVSLTAVKLTTIGAQTRTALEALREVGVDFIEEWSPTGPAS
jgi:TolA-binding protein